MNIRMMPEYNISALVLLQAMLPAGVSNQSDCQIFVHHNSILIRKKGFSSDTQDTCDASISFSLYHVKCLHIQQVL